MDHEILLRVLRGQSTLFEERRVRAWRDEAPEHDRIFRQLAEAWQHTAASADGLPTAPSPARMRSEADRRRTRDRVVLKVRRIAAFAAVLALAVGSTWYARRATVRSGVAEFAAGPLDAASVTLTDGSFVRLAPGGRLRVEDAAEPRRVWLDGRAFFAVAEDRGRPFVVRTRTGTITVLGTRFEVASRESDLHLVVVEGQVTLEVPQGSVRVDAGEVADVRDGGAPTVVEVADPLALLDWPAGLLMFQTTPLEQVVSEVGRHFGQRILIVNSALADRTVTAWFENQSFENVLVALCLIVDAECSVQDSVVRMR